MSTDAACKLDIRDLPYAMVTRIELAELLKSVSVEDVVQESGVSPKTVYRLRHLKNAPTLDMAERLLAAIARIRERGATPRRRAKKAAPVAESQAA